jgi:hypothetical protein
MSCVAAAADTRKKIECILIVVTFRLWLVSALWLSIVHHAWLCLVLVEVGGGKWVMLEDDLSRAIWFISFHLGEMMVQKVEKEEIENQGTDKQDAAALLSSNRSISTLATWRRRKPICLVLSRWSVKLDQIMAGDAWADPESNAADGWDWFCFEWTLATTHRVE